MWLLFALFSSIFAAAVAIFGKLGLQNLDTTLATTLRSIIMAVFLVIISVILGKFSGFSFESASTKEWIFIVLAGIAGALSWLFYFLALKNGNTTAVVAIDRMSIVFVAILAVLFLGEDFSWKLGFGVLFMFAGAFLISWK